MPIVVTCQCGARFAAQDHLAGKAVKCPKCAQPLKIPSPSAPSSPVPAVAPPSAVGGILDDVGIAVKTGASCPKCDAPLASNAVICVKCGFQLRKGKKVAVDGDAVASQRLAKIHEQQQVAAERASKQRHEIEDAVVTPGMTTDLGGPIEAATAILMRPVATYTKLHPIGGTLRALEFACFVAMFLAGFWMLFFTLHFFRVPLEMAFRHPDSADEVGKFVVEIIPHFLQGCLYLVGFLVVYTAVSLLVTAPCMALFAHLIVKLVGQSKLTFGATYRVMVYSMGATWMLSGLCCLAVAVPIVWPLNVGIGLAAHHRVTPPVALLATVLAFSCGGLLAFVVNSIFSAYFVALWVVLQPPPFAL